MRACAPGPTTSEQVGEARPSRTAIMIPIRLQPQPDHIEPSGPWPSTCRRTRPTSILAFGSGSRAFRPQRRTSRFRFTDLVVGHVVAGHLRPPRQTKICRPLFSLEARGDILADPAMARHPSYRHYRHQRQGMIGWANCQTDTCRYRTRSSRRKGHRRPSGWVDVPADGWRVGEAATVTDTPAPRNPHPAANQCHILSVGHEHDRQ